MKKIRQGLTFDDIMVVPAYTEVNSRSECSTKTMLLWAELDHPVIPANMDTITEEEMLYTILRSGGIGFIHRFMNLQNQSDMVRQTLEEYFAVTWKAYNLVPVTIGIKEKLDQIHSHLTSFSNLDSNSDNVVLLDVAHADSRSVYKRIKDLREFFDGILIAGNVATSDAVLRMIDAGVNGVKVGIGSGSICSTRLVTGHGVPQVTALQEADSAREIRGLDYNDFMIISDGGCNHYGDVVKALALGANFVMSGKLFAGCPETPGEFINNSQGVPSKVYRGMASYEAQSKRTFNTKTAEGVSHIIPIRGSASSIIEDIRGAIRSGLSYSGVTTLRELYEESEFIMQTGNGLNESNTRR